MSNAAISKRSRLLRKPWYAFWRMLEKKAYWGHAYSLQVPYGQRIFTPWFEKEATSDFAHTLSAVRAVGPLVVSPDRCYMLYQFALRALALPGDMAECGVYTGGTAQLISSVIAESKQLHKGFHLFDSFSGMPAESSPKRDYHSPGDFSDTSLARVKDRLRQYPFCEFHPGFMPATFDTVADIQQYSFVHVDVDIYPSVKVCCEWFWPRMVSGGVMIFDDYGFYPYRFAAKAAADEYFSQRIEKPIALPTGQAFVIKI